MTRELIESFDLSKEKECYVCGHSVFYPKTYKLEEEKVANYTVTVEFDCLNCSSEYVLKIKASAERGRG